MIRACELLGKRGVPFRCEIAGGGPLQVPLKEEITKRGLDGIVTLLGVCDQERVGGMLALASVFALASVITADGDLDGIPVSLMEAMAAGVPCVSTRVSGIPELIESPREGLLVAPGNPEELADAIEKLLKDADLRTRIGAAAREKVAREFNLEASARRLAELFRSSLGSGPAGVRP